MTTHLQGLSSKEVAARIAQGKTNDAHEQTSRSLKDILQANLFTRFNALLGVLLIIVLAVGSPIDALFGLVVIINSAIGIFQEIRAKRTLDRLAIMNSPSATVLRDGAHHTIPITQVVLDDVLKISAGDQIPADAKILQSEGLEIDESLLTGEADPVAKNKNDAALSGSIVVAGSGYAQATAVGVDSYAHSISSQVKKFTRARSELIDGTNKLLTYISWVILIVSPLLIWGQLAHSNNSWQEALVRSIAAIVGMIPEGLVLLTSLAFMLATLALARRKVLVQQLPAVEGLARVDIMCLDKTGTLTEGKIVFDSVVELTPNRLQDAEHALATFAAEPNSPTLQALHAAFKDGQKPKSAIPFSSARKWSAVQTADGVHWVMGAPEVVLPDTKSTAFTRAARVAGSGKRVMVLLTASTSPKVASLPDAMQPVALVVLAEKVRADAKETLDFFASQGVELKVISGDSPRTVAAIAKEVGLRIQGEPINARTLTNDPTQLAEVLESHNVFGRVNPDQKRAIVKALQSKGHVVAMTGDGVNDALALKDADIGVAMGSGAQATKAIAELVLLDNQFSRMPRVLAEGRRVIANIERVANLFLIKNVYSLVLALAVTVAAMPYPFLPRHLSVLSALTIGIPAFFLSLAPNNQRYQPGFLRRVLGFAVPCGVTLAALIFASYFVVLSQGGTSELASTAASLVVMLVGAWILICLARPLKTWKLAMVATLTTLFIAFVAVPISRDFLQFEVSATQLPWVIGFSLAGAAIVELLWRRDHRARQSAQTKTSAA
ncbi:MAG TPA: HAD-IC family P-type ATPase [Candidatus Saccharimonadales bacterium]|nr:HAD-IC family P-type ATPase [Candidatus Saccharimonadales bacterium]